MRRLAVLLCAAFFVLYAAALFPPLAARAAEERYLCEWEDGTVTSESYASAFGSVVGAAGGGILLEREGVRGTIGSSEALREAEELFAGDGLAEMLVYRCTLPRLFRAALFRELSGTLFVSDGLYRYNGEGLEPASAGKAACVALLDGKLPTGTLLASGAELLRVGRAAEISPSDLYGSAVRAFEGTPPYEAEDGVLLLGTAGGTRLIAGAPAAVELEVPDVAFADEGALSPCTSLVSLSIPFAGSSKTLGERDARGEFAMLFEADGAYRVPSSLRTVRVRGGKLDSFAFYACPSVRTVDACGVSAEDTARDAFLGMEGWEEIRSARGDLLLTGEYTVRTAPCGCYLYTKS